VAGLERGPAIAPIALGVDACHMTRRAWTILAVGVLAVAASGAFAVASGRSTSSIRPSPYWGMYSAKTWQVVAAKFERRGFSRASVHIVTGTRLMQTNQPFGILGARDPSGRLCFAVVRGTSLGPTICRVSEPLVVFAARDVCIECSTGRSPVKTTEVVVLVRRDVQGVSMIDQGRESGIGISPAGGGMYAFNAATVRKNTVLRARGEGHTILAETLLRRP
jgi:hypothetical protein